MIGEPIVAVLIARDGLSREDARAAVDDFIVDFKERIARGDYDTKHREVEHMCEVYFGLEPDYLDEILFSVIS